MDPTLRAVLPDKRVAGTAFTLRLPHADSTILHYAMAHVRPGDFMVIDRCGNNKHACWGGVMTIAAKEAGVVGAVIDGVATDFEEIRNSSMPMWCKGPSPITTKILGLDGAMNVPVSVGGVAVNPGDIILADESGVLVLDPKTAEGHAKTALAKQDREVWVLEEMKKRPIGDISGATAKVEANLIK